MIKNITIKAPFFEIGPKNYLWGDDVVELAKVADAASKKYNVDIIFTTPIVEIRRVKEATEKIHVFAPHMDSLTPGRGLADILPESLVAAGAETLKEAIKLLWLFRVPWGWTYTAGTVADWIAKFSFGFYSLMLTSTIIGFVVNILFKPRTWCSFCPMGTMTQMICKIKAKEKL